MAVEIMNFGRLDMPPMYLGFPPMASAFWQARSLHP